MSPIESPFVSEELFASEPDPALSGQVARLAAASPFLGEMLFEAMTEAEPADEPAAEAADDLDEVALEQVMADPSTRPGEGEHADSRLEAEPQLFELGDLEAIQDVGHDTATPDDESSDDAECECNEAESDDTESDTEIVLPHEL